MLVHTNYGACLPIRTLSALTGVNSVTIRAWERRYGLLKPLRTSKGHRLYNQGHVQQIKKILHYLQQGIAISQIKPLLGLSDSNEINVVASTDQWQPLQQQMRLAIANFDQVKLNDFYNQALSLYPIDVVTKYLLLRVFELLKNEKAKRVCLTAEYNFFQMFLRNKLGARFHHETRLTAGEKLLVVSEQNDYDEIILLLFSLTAMVLDYSVVCFHVEDRLDELVTVAQRVNSQAIVLVGNKILENEAQLQQLIQKAALPIFSFTYGNTEALIESKKLAIKILHDDFRLALEQILEDIR